MLLAVSIVKKYAIMWMEVKNSCIYGYIDDQIYMIQLAFTMLEPEECVNLKKALYGLKQSPHMWYLKLFAILEKHQFKRSNHDESLFISK